MTTDTPPTAEKRYLELLRRSLLNETYVENEIRLLYIFLMIQSGKPIDDAALRNPAAFYPDLVKGIRAARAEGRPWYQMQLRKADGSASDFKWETGIKHDASNSRPEFSRLLRDLQQQVQERTAASGGGKGVH